jgi:hypothetical protein
MFTSLGKLWTRSLRLLCFTVDAVFVETFDAFVFDAFVFATVDAVFEETQRPVSPWLF